MRTVVACDPEPVAIEGLRALLESMDGLRVVAGAGSLPEAIRAIADWNPNVAILDKSLGMEQVMECLRSWREMPGAPRAVVWGASVSGSEAVRLLRAGAAAVIRKSASLPMLMECVNSVANGGSWVEDGVVMNGAAAPLSNRRSLTARELQIVELVERGLSNKGIAAELGIRVGTVKIHLRHIFEKTGIHGRYGLALFRLRSQRPPADGHERAVEAGAPSLA